MRADSRDMRVRTRLALVATAIAAVLLACGGVFPAGPSRAEGASWRFAVITDTHVTETSQNLLPEMAASMADDGVELVLCTGDNVDGGVSGDRMQAQLANWQGALAPLDAAGIEVYPVRGNHEAGVPGSTTAWNNVFSGPDALPANGPAGETNLTFSVAHNNALFIGLDEFISGQEYRVNQAWLESLLAGTRRPHVFTFGHAPAFETGHVNCLGSYPSERNAFWSGFDDAGGRVYFCGHDHYLDLARIDDGDGEAGDDLYQCLVGPGCARINGAATYDGVNSPYTPVNVYHESANGYELVEVSGAGPEDLDVTMTWMQRTFNPSSGLFEYEPTQDVLSYAAGAADTMETYFAEGTTREGFDEWLCLQNPGGSAVDVHATYMFSEGDPLQKTYPVPPGSRLSVDVNQEVGAGRDVSVRLWSYDEFFAERPLYFDYGGSCTGGSVSSGAAGPSPTWYFAEGTTLPGFDQYVTVLNPSSETAHLTFRYMVEGVGELEVGGSVAAGSRATFDTRAQIGPGKNAGLVLASDRGIVAERPMYFDYGPGEKDWAGGHDVVGATSPAAAWYFPEGTTREGFEEWLCLQNPSGSLITVNALYQPASGQGDPVSRAYGIPAGQRLTVSVNEELGPGMDVSVRLTSNAGFIAERPMYFDYKPGENDWSGGHTVMGAASPFSTWCFPEGTTRAGFEEYLCLQNPGSADARATVTYSTSAGKTIERSWTVGAGSRLTIDVNRDCGPGLDVSVSVSSDIPIVAERPMYFDYGGGWTGGHTAVGSSL